MPRIRTLKPEIWHDEALGRCPIGARLLYVGMITQADDEGRLRAAVPFLRSAIFPYDPKVSVGMVQGWLDALVMEGRIRTYVVDGETYADLPGWSKNQRINRPTPSVLPKYQNHDRVEKSGEDAGDSVTTHGAFNEDSVRTHVRKGREGIGREEPLSSWPGEDGEVWNAYTDEHPRATPTPSRRRLLQARRNEGFDQPTLLAAIIGNHVDPWCNGQNPDGKTYHGWDLIFRDAGKVEKYAALAHGSANGKKRMSMADADRIIAEHEAQHSPPIEPEDVPF